jgi:hypothetical protein
LKQERWHLGKYGPCPALPLHDMQGKEKSSPLPPFGSFDDTP